MLNRPHTITADVEIPPGGAHGILLCQGSNAGGWAFYIADGRLHYAHNYVRRALYHVASAEPLPEGRCALAFEFAPTGEPDIPHGKGTPGRALLYLDRRRIGQGDLPITTPVAFNPGGLTCGGRSGLRGDTRLHPTVPVHRHPAHRHGGPVRRTDHRYRQ